MTREELRAAARTVLESQKQMDQRFGLLVFHLSARLDIPQAKVIAAIRVLAA